MTVMKLLGHKRVETSMKYIDSKLNFEDNKYEVAAATDAEEAKKLIAAKYEFVCEKKGITLFRKLKRF